MFFSKKKKAVAQGQVEARKPTSEPSFLGRDVTLEGQLFCEGELHIDGTIRGMVRAGLCVVDRNGVIQGELSGQVVHIRGRVLGPVRGGSVFIHAGAHVEGDVFHETISIENGAFVQGTVRHVMPAPVIPAEPPQGVADPLSVAGKDQRIIKLRR